MGFHDLIRSYVKNNPGKHFVYERLIRDLVSFVSHTHELNEADVLKTCEAFLKNRETIKICKGLVASKNNTPCTCPVLAGEDYCKRHLFFKEYTPEKETGCCRGITKAGHPCSFRPTHGQFCKRHQVGPTTVSENVPKKTRCSGENQDGSRCVRDARDGDTLCGLHKKKQDNDKLRKTERIPCAFYDIQDDGFRFCPKCARNDQWFCSKHEHLQTQYTSIYKKSNLNEYLSDPNYTNDVIEQLLKENQNK